jgi:hypothetical protein
MSKDSLQAHFEAYWLQTVLEDRAESAPRARRRRPPHRLANQPPMNGFPHLAANKWRWPALNDFPPVPPQMKIFPPK